MTDEKWKDDGMSSIFWTYTERTGRGVYNYRLIQYYKDDGMSSLFWIYTERTGRGVYNYRLIQYHRV